MPRRNGILAFRRERGAILKPKDIKKGIIMRKCGLDEDIKAGIACINQMPELCETLKLLDRKLQMKVMGEDHLGLCGKELRKYNVRIRLKCHIVGVDSLDDFVECYERLWEQRENIKLGGGRQNDD